MEYEKIQPDEMYECIVKIGGRYKYTHKRFKGEEHYSNWVNYIQNKGGKVVGSELLTKNK